MKMNPNKMILAIKLLEITGGLFQISYRMAHLKLIYNNKFHSLIYSPGRSNLQKRKIHMLKSKIIKQDKQNKRKGKRNLKN